MNRNRGGFGRNNHRGGSFGGRQSRNFQHRRGSNHRGRGFGQGSYGNRDRSSDNHWQNRPRRDAPSARLMETDIGVTEYVTKNEGFTGIIKARYSDFQVSEINEAGTIAKLTDLSVPKLDDDDKEVNEDEELLLSKYNLELLPMETWDQINNLVVKDTPTAEKVQIDVTGMPKQHRTKIHEAVKKAFGAAIVSSTVSVDDKKMVSFERYRKGVRMDRRVKWKWPGEYIHFILHKENCDTMEAVSRLAEKIGITVKPSTLGYAGTKDRRAITSQWISQRRVEPKRIASAAVGLRDIHVGNFYCSDVHLKLGMLKGNLFRIVLRNVVAPQEQIDACCQSLRDHGFINYYGLQRFGTNVDMPTYQLGKLLLTGKFKEATEAILSKCDGFPPSRNTPEGNVARALAQRPNDYVTALDKIPRNMRLLYVHSYQSLIWNQTATARINKFGLTPSVGDLVSTHCLPLQDDEENTSDEESDTEMAQDGIENQDGAEIQDGEQTDKQTNEQTKLDNKGYSSTKKAKVNVTVLTEEDITSEKYSIFDVILPLPGYDIVYPPNMKEYYEELLTKDGISMQLKSKIKCYNMSGAYRHLIGRCSDVTWSCVNYNEPTARLLVSDWDELQNRTQTDIVTDGKYKAVILKMTLPSSCYATMALRELLKTETSGTYQATQNDHERKRPLDTIEEGQSEIDVAKKAKLDDCSGLDEKVD